VPNRIGDVPIGSQVGDTSEDQIVHDRGGQLGFDNLLVEEQDYTMIWCLVAEVFNGTFAQYFSNETGDHAQQALHGLEKWGASDIVKALEHSIRRSAMSSPPGPTSNSRWLRRIAIVTLLVVALAVAVGIWRPWRSTQQPEHTLTHPGSGVHLLAFSPDDTQLVLVDSSGKVILWDAGTGQQLYSTDKLDDPSRLVDKAADSLSDQQRQDAAIARDQTMLVLGSMGTSFPGALIAVVPRASSMHAALETARQDSVRVDRLSRAVLATGQWSSGPLGPLPILRLPDPKPLFSFPRKAERGAWSASYQTNRWVGVASLKFDESMRFPFGEKEKPRPTNPVCVVWVSSVRVTFLDPDRRTYFGYSQGQQFLYEGGSSGTSSSHLDTKPVRLAAFASSGKVRLEAQEGIAINVVSVDSESARAVALTDSLKADKVVVTDDIAAGLLPEGAIALWDLKTGKINHSLTGPSQGTQHLALSADGKRLVTAGADRLLRIWDTASGKQLHVCNEQGQPIHRLALSADGKRVLTSHGSKDALLWDVETGRQLTRLPPMGWPALSADGKRAADVEEKQVRIWNIDKE